MPDTVCVNEPVNITNAASNATNYFWNFCAGNSFSAPTGVNLGNLGNTLAYPVFSDIVTDNGNYYLFVSNNWPGGLVRMDFGNSLLNTPVAVPLGNVGGVVINTIQGLQVVKNEGKWYVIMVGGHSSSGIISRVIKVELGANITNTNPVGTNWGNLGNLAYPVDLHLFQEGNRWYGLTLNAENSTMTRFDFSTSFDNVPVGQNLGNPGGNFTYPTGIYAINDNNNWHVFVVNDEPDPDLIRLDFGNSLLNTPTPVNLGNPNNVLQKTRDICFLKECGQITAFAVNGATFDQFVRLDFGNSLLSTPIGTNLGNIGTLSFPHSLSKFFRVDSDIYTFITNVYSNSITRLRFSGCTNSSMPNFSAAQPPPLAYNAPGIYTVTQTIDIGLPTQTSSCRQVVVLDKLPHQPVKNLNVCAGDSIKIGSSSTIGTYTWNNGSNADSIFITTAGYHWVETQRFGCANRDSFLVTIVPSPSVALGNDTLICSSATLLLNAGNPGAGYAWNTGAVSQTLTVSGVGQYSVTVTSNGCSKADTINVQIFNTAENDFSYKQDVCDGLTVSYNGLVSGYTDIMWDFGDGGTNTGSVAPTHHYAAYGTYDVKMDVTYGACQATIIKTITIGVQNDPLLVLTPDSTICVNNTLQLKTAPALGFCWFPTDYLDNPLSPTPVTSTTKDITYYFTAEVNGVNLIANGDFSQGNTGFQSAYSFNSPNTTEGQYFIGTSPRSWNAGLNNCPDHTSGSGNMMMVNGSPVADAIVWKQTVTVTSNTNYAFSTWIQSLLSQNPAQLQFSINGKILGAPINASGQSCNWNLFYSTWNSGSAATAEIAIVNKNTILAGNDFALDDISFAQVFIKQDSVKITVEKPAVVTNADTIICSAKAVQLFATGAQDYSWSPNLALTDGNINNPVANPANSTQYIVTGTTTNGCVAKDTVQINVFTKPAIGIQADTAICRNTSLPIWVNGGVSYAWNPSFTMSDPSSATPVVSPLASTLYQVVITDGNACEHRDSVRVDILPDPVFTVNAPVQTCLKDSVSLTASGGDQYVWSPSLGLNDPAAASPRVSPPETTDYEVTVTENTCGGSATLQTRVTVSPLPSISASSSNDIDCSYDRSRLDATGARTYAWTPSATLSNAGIHNPVATPTATTTYIVAGTDRAGCTGYDTLTVKVDNSNKGGYLIPGAFTPNNDGLNDCYGVKYWGIVENIEFSIFDRWGVRIFYSKEKDACWDGTYKGLKQPAGVYVYMIRASTNCENPVFRKGALVLVR